MKVIYVAGPYRARTEWGVTNNIRAAEEAALALWRMGWAVICPHKNTAYFGGAAPDDVWLKGDLAILEKCDAVYAMDGWLGSQGARDEILLAKEKRIPVYFGLDQCRAAVGEERGR